MTELSRLEPKVKLPQIKQTEKKTTQSKSILQYLLAKKISIRYFNDIKVIKKDIRLQHVKGHKKWQGCPSEENTNSNKVVNFNT